MTKQRLFSVLKMPLCVVLFAELLPSQMPSAPGRLSVASTPPGATVTIDGRQMSRPAPSTFTVSPGSHKVTAETPAGEALTCNPGSPNVYSGSTVRVSCTRPKK